MFGNMRRQDLQLTVFLRERRIQHGAVRAAVGALRALPIGRRRYSNGPEDTALPAYLVWRLSRVGEKSHSQLLS